MSGDYVELRLASLVDSADIIALLSDEPEGAWESDGMIHLYWPESGWSPHIVGQVESALRALGVDAEAAGMTQSHVRDQDWNSVWARSLAPIQIGRVSIRQSWNRIKLEPGGIELVIDPRRAFGTGYHATTQLIVERLQECIRGAERILDVGTGSGVLAMVALKLGAASAVGIDNDPIAIECAREYAEANRFGPELDLRIASLEQISYQRFDWILANLDRKTLLYYAPLFASYLNRGARALLSGLLIEDRTEMEEALSHAGGKTRGRWERGEWTAIEVEFGDS